MDELDRCGEGGGDFVRTLRCLACGGWEDRHSLTQELGAGVGNRGEETRTQGDPLTESLRNLIFEPGTQIRGPTQR